MKTKLNLLLLALALAATALVTVPLPAHAIYCWHATAEVTCCRLASGQITCTGD